MKYASSIKEIWIVLLFLITTFIFSSYHIGPATIRVYGVVLMILYLLFDKNRPDHKIHIGKAFIKVYILFLSIMCFCLIANGELLEYGYFKRLLAFHLPCFVVFYAIIFKVNTRKNLNGVLFLVVSMLLFDCIITVLQYKGNALSWTIGQILTPIEEINEKAVLHESVIGYSIIPGIFGGVVRNAYYICSLFPLVFVYNSKTYDNKVKVLSLFVIAIAFFAVYITQQRTAFYLILASLAVYMNLRVVKKPILILFILILIILFYSSLESTISNIDYGRLLETHDDSREKLWQAAFAFISDNWLLGAPMKFQRIAGVSAHNLALDGIIFSGIGGFVTLMLFVFMSLRISINGCLGYIKGHYGNITLALSLAFTSCVMYGFTHNTSVLTGEPCIFLLLALLLKSIELDRLNVNY